jgi:hypothetical protein
MTRLPHETRHGGRYKSICKACAPPDLQTLLSAGRFNQIGHRILNKQERAVILASTDQPQKLETSAPLLTLPSATSGCAASVAVGNCSPFQLCPATVNLYPSLAVRLAKRSAAEVARGKRRYCCSGGARARRNLTLHCVS